MGLIDVVCPNCGEYLEGDGFKKVLHCPNAESMKVDFSEPVGDIILCVDLGVSDMYGFENYTFEELRDRYSFVQQHSMVKF